jgi:hypothetical protein
MSPLPEFVVAGIPLVLLVFALVEEIKAYGLTGKILRLVSLLVGLVVAMGYQLAIQGVPVGFAGWFTVIVVGLLYGLTASGGYDFVDARWAPIKKVG